MNVFQFETGHFPSRYYFFETAYDVAASLGDVRTEEFPTPQKRVSTNKTTPYFRARYEATGNGATSGNWLKIPAGRCAEMRVICLTRKEVRRTKIRSGAMDLFLSGQGREPCIAGFGSGQGAKETTLYK